MRSHVTSLGAQFLALVIGANITNAMPRFQLQVGSIAAEGQKQNSMSSRKRHNLVVQSAAMPMEKHTLRNVVTVHVKFLALVTGLPGRTAVPSVVVALHLALSKSHSQQNMVAQTAHTMMATRRLSLAMNSHAPLIAKDHGVLGVNAANNALIARVMVPLAPSLVSSPSQSRRSTVANSAQKLMARLRSKSAMTSVAHRIALDPGQNSLSALLHAEMESRSASIISPAPPLMVAQNARDATFQATPWPATMVHAQSIVQASGQRGRIAPRSAMVVRRHPGS